MNNTRRHFLQASCSLAATSAVPFAWAQAYPSRPIIIVVPFPPGGLSDPVARLVGRKLGEALGQPVIVENKPGAGSQLAAAAVKNALPDGYTLFMGHMGSQALNIHLYSKLNYAPTDFVPITSLVQTPHWLIVNKDSPAKSVADLVEMSKAKPDSLTFASQGVGTGGQLLGEMFKVRSGVTGTHVPYKGSGPALLDLLANRVDYFFDSVSTSLQFVRDGKLRVLAVASAKRLPQAPDTPTLAEVGYPGMELSFWFGLFARAETPAPILARLNTELVKIVNSQEMRDATVPIGVEPVSSTPAELTARIQTESVRWGKVIKDARITSD